MALKSTTLMLRPRLIHAILGYLHCLLVVVIVAPSIGITFPAAGEEFERAVLTGTHGDQQFVAGGRVRIAATISDDLIVAGGEIVVGRTIAEDVIAAGGSLRFREITAHDVIMAGGQIDFEGEIADDLVAAGGRVYLGRDASIAGDAWLAGGNLDIDGSVGGRLTAGAGSIRLGGVIDGDVDLSAGTIVVAPGAHIGGTLVYRSGEEAEIAADAVIMGVSVGSSLRNWQGPSGAGCCSASQHGPASSLRS